MKKFKPHILKFLPLILLIGICLVSFFFFKYKSENPKIEWDTSPDNIVISYGYFGEIDYGYIPDFRVWGDGYIVWVEDDGFSRKVYEGYLTQSELFSLFKKFKDAEFFKECQKYHNYALGYISISLLEKSCSILIDYNGTINNNYYKISRLVDFLTKGAGVEKKRVFSYNWVCILYTN